MKTRAVISLLSLLAAVQAARAETIVVDDKVTVRESDVPRPKGGMRMADVEQKFGAPVTRHPTVGEPPITRWDYPAFAVFFEKDQVIHAVVTAPDADKAPATTDKAPEAADKAPAPTEKAPEAADKASDSADKKPDAPPSA